MSLSSQPGTLKKKLIGRLLYTKKHPEAVSFRSYGEKFNGTYYKVYDKLDRGSPSSTCHGGVPFDFERNLKPEWPEAGVLKLNEATWNLSYILSQEGFLLYDHLWFGHPETWIEAEERVTFCKIPDLISKRIPGISLCLSIDMGELHRSRKYPEVTVVNFGHYLLDCLPRLELFYKAGFKLSDVDHIICPKPPEGSARHLFNRLNIPPEKCIFTHTARFLRFETLIVPGFPGSKRNYPPWVPRFLQKTFVPDLPKPGRRIYTSRKGFDRCAANEDAVEQIFKNHGFEIYNPYDHFKTNATDFAEATIVAGSQGSNLANIAFCQPGTQVLELLPSDMLRAAPYWYTLSNAADLRHNYLICKSCNPHLSQGPSRSDYDVDEKKLEQALVRMTSPRSDT